MILDQYVKITYSNNKRHYVNLGYPDMKQGSQVMVWVCHLPRNSNKIVLCSCDDCDEEFSRGYQIVMRSINKIGKVLCFDCSRKEVGRTMDMTNTIKASKLRVGSKHQRWNPNKDELNAYRSEVYRHTRRQSTHILENSDKPRTVCGVDGGYQLDHVISIKEGFERGLDPNVIGGIDNLRFIPWEENRKKWF